MTPSSLSYTEEGIENSEFQWTEEETTQEREEKDWNEVSFEVSFIFKVERRQTCTPILDRRLKYNSTQYNNILNCT